MTADTALYGAQAYVDIMLKEPLADGNDSRHFSYGPFTDLGRAEQALITVCGRPDIARATIRKVTT